MLGSPRPKKITTTIVGQTQVESSPMPMRLYFYGAPTWMIGSRLASATRRISERISRRRLVTSLRRGTSNLLVASSVFPMSCGRRSAIVSSYPTYTVASRTSIRVSGGISMRTLFLSIELSIFYRYYDQFQPY